MLKKLYFVVVEAAIELVPKEIKWHPSVRKYAARRGKSPTSVLLDRSYHHAAMLRLRNNEKRGRPDIAYHILLDAVASPMYKRGLLSIYVETYDGNIIELGEGVRLPRAYHRFVGLIEDLYEKREIVADSGELLLAMRKQSLKELLEELKPDFSLLLREQGEKSSYEQLAEELVRHETPLVGVGGFPYGDFREDALELFNNQVAVAGEPLDASLVACRLVYEVEKRLL